MDEAQVDLVAQQLADVGDAVFDHGRPLQAQSESVYPQVLGQAHRLQHLRPEHTTVADLDELVQTFVVAEDLHARFGVRVVTAGGDGQKGSVARDKGVQ